MRIIKIGKAESNDIYKDYKNDPTVSREHCEIFMDDEGNTFLTDLNSTNGTYINGKKIDKPVKLGEKDIVKAGNSLVNWKGLLMKGLNKKDEVITNDSIDPEKSGKNQASLKNSFEQKESTKDKSKIAKYFSYDDEYISGGTYFVRLLLQSFLILLFGLGIYLMAVTIYKRAKSLGHSNGASGLLIFISFIPYLSIIPHWYLWFSNGNEIKFKENIEIKN